MAAAILWMIIELEKKYEIVCLGGRLGNQLFQVAFSKMRELKHGYDIYFDIDAISKHDFLVLQQWTGPLRIASQNQIYSLRGNSNAISKIWRLLQRAVNLHYRTWVLQTRSEFQAEMLKNKGPCYFVGYWQSYKYFSEISDVIRSSFNYDSCNFSFKNRDWLEMAKQKNSISIHIRRGDYLNNKSLNVVSFEYYHRALDALRLRITLGPVLVFSDDQEWCNTSLNLGLPFHVVNGNINQPEIDLFLMSKCKHHIITNSTFSWWGAWLGSFDNSITIAPNKWFPSYSGDPPLDDIYPSQWLRIQA